ncbi:MAG: DNA mismatch repair endonuclease MutL [Chloroflexi bacterium]|nr:DNA mismatch repair endonuclease MutL [Chloroflexota bacterium]
MPIQLLSDQLASQIAAGEVVERPSSVVKELVENSLDAGATTVNIDVREAGRKSIQIADNGQGIPADQLETAFLRHATSKLKTIEDLNAIGTLGFRGEALAAIAAVSQVTVVSRAKGEKSGVRLTMEGGKKTGRDTVGAPQGTVIAVDNLFYNVPARLKFLKSTTTEKRLIDEIVTRYAMAYPHVRFRLIHNGRITFQTTGSGQVLDVLVGIYGADVARHLLEIEPEEGQRAEGRRQKVEGRSEKSENISHPSSLTSHPSVSGFVGPPSVHYANRSHITFFVNGRWVKDNSLTYAVIQAYHTLLPTGRYPMGILFLTLPPDQVDVNVHPTKTEVRFRQGKTPFSTVQRAVRQTLVADAPIRSMTAWSMGSMESHTPGWEGALDHSAFTNAAQGKLGLDWDKQQKEAGVDGGETAVSQQPLAVGGDKLPIMRVVGQIGAAYIISEGPDGLFLIDQQAAHTRALADQLQTQFEGDGIVKQGLPSGTAVTLSAAQTAMMSTTIGRFATLGFQIEPFGPNAFMVRGVPQALALLDPAQVVLTLVMHLEQHKDASDVDLLAEMATMAAIKSGQTLTPSEMADIIQQLEQCRDPFVDVNGRPTFIYLSVAQLAREFGRI